MLYTKTINGRQVFDQCKTIQIDGVWVSNPSEEQIFSQGWEVYVPPVTPAYVPQEPDTDEVLRAVKRMLQTEAGSLSDEDALEVAALFPSWASKMGTEVQVGERLWYDGALYKVIQGHTVQEGWTPDVTPALFVVVSIEEWPEWVQPTGSEDAYNTGDRVTYNGEHYISLIDANAYSPEAYPAGWEKVIS